MIAIFTLATRPMGSSSTFSEGQRADWDGRGLTDIRTWDDAQLDHDHHYIQWLFPLTTESEAVFAPVLRAFEVVELRYNRLRQTRRRRPAHRNDPMLQEQMMLSLYQMLAFYGFTLCAEQGQIAVVPSERHRERLEVWMTPDNHNYRRISRILGSLTLAELSLYARAFLQASEQLYTTPEGHAAIDGVAM